MILQINEQLIIFTQQLNKQLVSNASKRPQKQVLTFNTMKQKATERASISVHITNNRKDDKVIRLMNFVFCINRINLATRSYTRISRKTHVLEQISIVFTKNNIEHYIMRINS